MGSLSNYGEDKWMGHLFGTPYSPVAQLYLALCTADPTDAATGAAMNECADSGNYAREAISFAAAGSRAIAQTGIITFNQANGAWGTVSHWAIVDSGTHGAGNVLAHGAFTTPFAVVSGNTPSIASGQVQVSITASSGEGFTDQLCLWMLDKMFRNQVYAQPATYVALLDAAGDDADTTLTADEVAGNNYARVLVEPYGGNNAPLWSDVSGGAVSNANDVTFPTVGAGGWNNIVGMAIVDAGNNVLMFDNDQVVDQNAAANDTVKFATGDLDVSLS